MNESNNVYLRWSKHQATLVSVFDGLLDSEKLTDCTVSAEGHHLRAHKIILSACSPYFDELFSENCEKHPIIILHDVKYNVLKALLDFMYRGELNVPQEQLSDILKLSDSLRVRGLSGSGCVNNVDMQKRSERNARSVSPGTHSSQPASVSCFTSVQNERGEHVQSFRETPPRVSSQEGGSVEVDSISKAVQKSRKTISHTVADEGTAQNAFEVITPDVDSVDKLPSQKQVLATTPNSTGGPVDSSSQVLKTLLPVSNTTVCSSSYTMIPHQSSSRELQNSSGEMTIAKNERFLIPEAVLPDERSESLSAHQVEVSLETKPEALETNVEIVEDLTLDDDDDYAGAGDYRDVCNSVEVDIGEVTRASEDLTYEEIFCAQEVNNTCSPFGSVDLSNVSLSASQIVLRNRFICHSCGKSYQHQSGLWRHAKFQCGKEPQFQCPRCNYRCARSDHLKKHMASLRCQMQKKYALFGGDV
ncbi:longitudinals lacking protein-like isoform X2 [Schistocerca nitens]|uniref:longitudinals lacking protein-like isoform X2 n=1 Tax=Schistocerca nitens TaxID=7011 RepID=UPI00211937E0|nr:longitudinals lacking protein-like isoform X2 [Schistocerca nitens]XP_049794873.1 longitudinals lacking protein-like isoform X2 [Schistocerca nitens]